MCIRDRADALQTATTETAAISALWQALASPSSSSPTLPLQAVSYTHLDVYKRQVDWLVRSLNARRSDMDDSADLLMHHAAHSPLQRLQQQRLVQRLHAQPADLRAPWPVAALGGSLLLALLISLSLIHI